MQIYIHRDNEDFGPYSREAVLEYVKQGVFQEGDFACYAGMADWKTLSELLGIAGASESRRVTKFKDPDVLEPAAPVQSTTPNRQRSARMRRRASTPAKESKRRLLLAFNLLLLLIIGTATYIHLTGGSDKLRKYGAVLSSVLAKAATQVAEVSGTTAPVTSPAPANPITGTPLVLAPQASSSAPVAASASPSLPADSVATAGPAASATPAVTTASADPAAQSPATASTQAPATAAAPGPAKPFNIADLAGIPATWPKTLKLKQPVNFPAVFNGQIVGNVVVPAGAEVKLVDVEGEVLTVDYQGGTQKMSWKLTDLGDEAAKSAPVAPAAVAASVPVSTPVPPPASTPATDVTATASPPPPAGN